jgi:hypothetical protein
MYQNLGSINVPLVIANHMYRKDDRDRKGLYDFDVVSLIEGLASHIDAEASAVVLEYFKPYWYSYPRRKYDLDSFYNTVTRLTTNMARSSDVKRQFKEKHPNLLVAARVLKKYVIAKNRRSQALDWMRICGKKYRLVQQNFALLGYSSLEDECENNNGYTLTRAADTHEARYIKILELCTETVFGAQFFGYEKLPVCKIIINDDAAWRGMANCFPVWAGSSNGCGHKLRYRMDYVAIKKCILGRGKFPSAYSTYLHELCHVFGGDSSPNFSRALSDIIEIQLIGMKIIEMLAEKWDMIDDNEEKNDPKPQ